MRNFVAVFALLAAASAATVSPVNEYLPPLEETVTLDPTYNIDSAVLAKDGYHYKSQKQDEAFSEYLPPGAKLNQTDAKLKNIEDLNSATFSEESGLRPDDPEVPKVYLPPAEEASTQAVAENKTDNTVMLGENGYEYKVVRRLKYRHRREVTEIANEYLPTNVKEATEGVADLKSTEEPDSSAVSGENAELKSVEQPNNTAVLGENGYEYKAVRRLKYRQRRDVSEVCNDYLSPDEEASTEAVAEIKSVDEPELSAVLGENGYEYKTVRRLKYRHRRDVSEVPNDYLPPADEATTTETFDELKSVEEPDNSAVLGENGYEYKTVRRLKYRHRRDVSEVVNDYLPPAKDGTTETIAELKSVDEPDSSALLRENGYEYKTVRRLKYRQRRDISEVPNDYLPPAEELSTKAVAELKSVEEPRESAVFGQNGYIYKTKRLVKYRQRLL